MIIPKPLSKGATIAITCPAGHLPEFKTIDAIATLKKWGYNVIVGNTVGNGECYFAGTIKERKDELQSYLDDSTIDAILMGRGGYGMSQIIDRLDFKKFKKHPKWICGFSDITLLHNHLQQKIKCASLHSPMCAAFMTQETVVGKQSIAIFKKALSTNNSLKYPIPKNKYNIDGNGKGTLVGGNLAMIAHSIGSPSQLKTKNCILFLEDIGEHLYKIDRMMIQLKRAGMLNGLSGLIFGQFSDVEDTTRPYGKDLYQILSTHIKDANYPICFDFPAGHEEENYTLKMGLPHQLKIVKNKVTLIQL